MLGHIIGLILTLVLGFVDYCLVLLNDALREIKYEVKDTFDEKS